MPRFFIVTSKQRDYWNKNMLLANNLSFQRDEKIIFTKLDISLMPKKIIHVSGYNGVGKTTLIQILANMLKYFNQEL